MEEKNINVRKRKIKWIIFITILILIGSGCLQFISFYLSTNRNIQQIYLVPKDAILILQSDNPVKNWQQFSKSEPWKCLKKAPSFAKVANLANTLDSILQSNKKILNLVGDRDLMISVHQIRPGKLDFLYIIDLQKISEVKSLKKHIGDVYSFMNYKVTYRTYHKTDIIELRDIKTRDIIYTAFVENHYVASMSSKLVEASIDEKENPSIGLDPSYIEADKYVSTSGIYRIFVQQAYLSRLINLYTEKDNNYNLALKKSFSYTGLSLKSGKEKFELNGYAFLKDTIDPYVSALFNAGKGEITAHKILSNRTALYTNICFDSPKTFIKELEKAMSKNDPALYDSYKATYNDIESKYEISLADDFLSWMSGELALSELEPGLLGYDPETVLAIRTNDLGMAQNKMKFIEKQIKKHSPLQIKKVTYKNHEVNYVELKGFFALFFGKKFKKFEKPYYTYVNDYVVFSNRPETILSFIEDYEQERTLQNDEGFKQIYSQMDKKSSYFVYMNSIKFYPLTKPLLNRNTWKNLSENKEILYSFPYSGFQMISDKNRVSMQLIMNYNPYKEENQTNDSDMETDDDNDNISPKAEIDELNRFYAEKFQGNVYREFYDEGTLKSECEIKDGMRNGTYHEYFPSGKLKIRGKYSKDAPKGTWKYYTEDGALEKKVKM